MSVRATCPNCRAATELPDSAAGITIRCGTCGEAMTVPAAGEAPPPLPADEPKVVELESTEQKPAPVARRVERRAEPAAAGPPKATRVRRWSDDERPRRDRDGGGGTVLLLLALGGGVLLLVGVVAVVGMLMYARSEREARYEAEIKAMKADQARRQMEMTKAEEMQRPQMEADEREDVWGPGEGPFDPGAPAVTGAAGPGLGGPPTGAAGGFPGEPDRGARLRRISSVPAPGAATQLAYSPRHGLLFARSRTAGVWVIDARSGLSLALHSPRGRFTDIALAPDESALYAVDHGKEDPWRTPSSVHRYDLAARTWEARETALFAYRVAVLDPWRFVLLERGPRDRDAVTLNRWARDGDTLTELARVECDKAGDVECDPKTGRVFHGSRSAEGGPGAAGGWPGVSGVNVFRVTGDSLRVEPDDPASPAGGLGPAAPGPGAMGGMFGTPGGSAALSADGGRFYYGRQQLDAADVRRTLRYFPERIVAATRDVAFGFDGYYDADTARRLGGYPARPAAIAVSPDGQSVWLSNPTTGELVQYAIDVPRKDAEKKDEPFKKD